MSLWQSSWKNVCDEKQVYFSRIFHNIKTEQFWAYVFHGISQKNYKSHGLAVFRLNVNSCVEKFNSKDLREREEQEIWGFLTSRILDNFLPYEDELNQTRKSKHRRKMAILLVPTLEDISLINNKRFNQI